MKKPKNIIIVFEDGSEMSMSPAEIINFKVEQDPPVDSAPLSIYNPKAKITLEFSLSTTRQKTAEYLSFLRQ